MSRETAQQALERAFMEQRPSLIGRIARLVGNMATAEDLAHEAFLRASAAAGETRIASPKAFLGRTAWNLAIDYVRRERREREIFARPSDPESMAAVASTEPSPEATALDRQVIALLDQALEGVPDRARRVLVLNRVEGWTYPEIAAHLGVSSTTVQKDIRLALARCIAVLSEKGLI